MSSTNRWDPTSSNFKIDEDSVIDMSFYNYWLNANEMTWTADNHFSTALKTEWDSLKFGQLFMKKFGLQHIDPIWYTPTEGDTTGSATVTYGSMYTSTLGGAMGSQFQAHIQEAWYSKAENIQRMFEIYSSEYNPLWNVDGTTTTQSVNASRTNTDQWGTVTTEKEFGDYTDTTTYGSKTDTATNDKVKTSVVTPQTTVTSTDSARGIDSTSLTNKASNQTVANAYTVDTTVSGTATGDKITNQLVSGGHTDDFIHDGHTDTDTTTRGTDTHTQGAHTDTITETRQGNIGVTMSTALLRDHQLLWEHEFDFYSYCCDVLAEILLAGWWY